MTTRAPVLSVAREIEVFNQLCTTVKVAVSSPHVTDYSVQQRSSQAIMVTELMVTGTDPKQTPQTINRTSDSCSEHLAHRNSFAHRKKSELHNVWSTATQRELGFVC